MDLHRSYPYNPARHHTCNLLECIHRFCTETDARYRISDALKLRERKINLDKDSGDDWSIDIDWLLYVYINVKSTNAVDIQKKNIQLIPDTSFKFFLSLCRRLSYQNLFDFHLQIDYTHSIDNIYIFIPLLLHWELSESAASDNFMYVEFLCYYKQTAISE